MNATRKPVTFHVRNGLTYRVRKIRTYAFALYRVDGQWVQADGRNAFRTVASYQRQQLPCVMVATTSTTLVRNGSHSYLTVTTVRGDYADVCEYLGELVSVSGSVSLRDGTGIMLTTHI